MQACDDAAAAAVLSALQDDHVSHYRPAVPYEVHVHTSDIRGAGTSANIYMDVYGRDDNNVEDSDHIEFERGKDRFERAKIDKFTFDIKDIGKPFKLRIGHDGRGMGAGWHLNKVPCRCAALHASAAVDRAHQHAEQGGV